MKKYFLYLIALILFAAGLSSCATAPRSRSTSGSSSSPITYSGPSIGPRTNRTHTVRPGETIWRISKMYDVPAATIISINHISNPSNLKMGQHLEIPGAAPIKPVITLFPSNKWKYIIIHHSATEDGKSLAFHHAHLAKGWDRGVGYHFVIDNGTNSKVPGQIEATPRWIKQEDGAHCKASDMNMKGIGICLVGNFDEDKLSSKQMDSLVYLVNTLKKYYKIPAKNIMGHGHVANASTHCPGKKFPWQEFKSRLE